MNSSSPERLANRRASRRTFLQGIVIATAGSLLAACGTPTSAPAPTQAPAKPTTPPAAQPTAAPAAKPTSAPAAATTAVPSAPAAAKPTVAAGQDMSAIEAAAKKEGQITLYSSMNLDDAAKILPIFEKRYGVKVDHVRAGSEKLIQRLVTEVKAGKVLADVLETNGLDWLQVLNEGMIDPYAPPEGKSFAADLRDPKDLWYTSRLNQIILMFNTSKVPTEQGQKLGWEDLADPKWKDQILIESGDIEWMMALAKRKYNSDEKTQELFKKIAANNPSMQTGHTETAELLTAGKGSVFASGYEHEAYKLQDKGAPIDFGRQEGVYQQQLVGLIKGAPHPNAAKLFENWLISPEGAQAIVDVGRAPGRQDLKTKHNFFPEGMKFYPQKPEDATDMPKYTKMWNEIFGLR